MIPIGSTAYNPQTGHQIVLTDKGWVDAGSPQMAASMSDPDKKSLTDLGEEARQAQWLAQKADQFRQIQQGKGQGDVTGTGAQYGDFDVLGHNLNPLPGMAAAINPRIGDLESVSNQAWAHMRPTGSGPLRMPEVEGFRQAFPNIANSPQTNSDIDSRLNQDASIAAQKLQFIDTFIRQNRGTYADANAAWQRAQQSAIGQQPLPPAAGQTQFGQPNYDTSGPFQYNAGQQSPSVPPQAQEPRVLTWDPATGQLK